MISNPIQDKLVVGQHYFYADFNDGFVWDKVWGDTLFDKRMMMLGNCFNTRKEAADYIRELDNHAEQDYAEREELEEETVQS